MNVNRFTLFWTLLLLVLSGCAAKYPIQQAAQLNGVAVVVVTQRDGVEVGINRSLLAQDLLEFLRDEGRESVLPWYRVQEGLGSDAYENLVDHYEVTGELSEGHLQRLREANLLMPFGLVARIESNEIIQREPEHEELRDNAGQRLYDRERIVLTTQRTTSLSATLIDLQSGLPIWTRTYSVNPVSKSSYTQYLGSSFSGSLAAALANTVANGLRIPQGPPAPSLRLTLRSLMREVVRNIPNRYQTSDSVVPVAPAAG